MKYLLEVAQQSRRADKEYPLQMVHVPAILAGVAEYFELTSEEMLALTRDRVSLNALVRQGARDVSAFITRELTGMPYEVIAEQLGRKDTSIVRQAIKYVKGKIDTDPKYAAAIQELMEQILSAAPHYRHTPQAG